MKRLIGLIQFLTRIPIKIDTGIDEAFYKSIIYFPVVGLILGICYYFIGAVSIRLFSWGISAILLLASMIYLTGGLHLDGVADTFDGLLSYRNKEKILEIMKDSRLGTNAFLALFILLSLKIVLLKEVLEQGKLWLVILMPVFARTMQVISCYKTQTPREKGMGNLFIGKVSTAYLIGVLFITVAINWGIVIFHVYGLSFMLGYRELVEVIFEGSRLLGILLLLIVGTKVFIKKVYKKIDGITGDILGCICEGSEVLFLLLAVVNMRV